MIFCIGNGESRHKIDLHFLKKYGTIYGSNALYRDFTPDILLTCDPMMLEEIIESGYSKENKVYTTEYGYGNIHDILKKIPKEHKISLMPFEKIYPVNSGWESIRLAYHFHPEDQIYMIGFDLFGDRNNMYDGTTGYPSEGASNDMKDEFVLGFEYLLNIYDDIIIKRVIDQDQSLENIPNVSEDELWQTLANNQKI